LFLDAIPVRSISQDEGDEVKSTVLRRSHTWWSSSTTTTERTADGMSYENQPK